MARHAVIAFIAGVLVTSVVLTRDASFGEDAVAALLSPADAHEILHREGARSSAHERKIDDTNDDMECLTLCSIVRAGADSRVRIGEIRLKPAFRAAVAATQLSAALWARVASPVTDAVRFGVTSGLSMALERVEETVRTTEPRVMVQWAFALVGVLYVYHLFRRLVKHLKRARYRNKLKFFIFRIKLRVQRKCKAVFEPFAKVLRALRGVGTAVRRKYSMFQSGVRNKSRLAAIALPHILFVAIALMMFRFMPVFIRKMLRRREVLATVVLLLPMGRTMLAMENGSMDKVEQWLRFWSSCAPIMMIVDFPLISFSLRWFFPWWPEVLVLFTLWLNSGLARGSHLILEVTTPLVTKGMAYLNQSQGRASLLLRQSFRRTLQIGVVVIRFRSARAAEALQQVLDNMSIPLVMCTVFFFTPGLITIYGCDVAGLIVPFAFTVDRLNKYHHLTAQPQIPSRAQVRKEAEMRHEAKLKSMLTYWLAHAMIWSIAQELSQSGLSWFPLWRHTQLAGIYWLQVFGGAQRITERMQSIKASIVEDHQQALKAAIAADLEVSKAKETEKSPKDDKSESVTDVAASGETESSANGTKVKTMPSDLDKVDVGITADGVRKRVNTSDAQG